MGKKTSTIKYSVIAREENELEDGKRQIVARIIKTIKAKEGSVKTTEETITAIIDKHGNVYFLGTPSTIPDSFLKGNKSIKTVTIPDSVKSIQQSAFECCSKLWKVTIKGENLDGIYGRAFYKTEKLIDINLPRSVRIIKMQAFYKSQLKELDIKHCTKLQCLDKCVFEGSKLERIYLPSNLSKICNRSFANCRKLKEVFYNGETKKERRAFENCPLFEKMFPYPTKEKNGVNPLEQYTQADLNIVESISKSTIGKIIVNTIDGNVRLFTDNEQFIVPLEIYNAEEAIRKALFKKYIEQKASLKEKEK